MRLRFLPRRILFRGFAPELSPEDALEPQGNHLELPAGSVDAVVELVPAGERFPAHLREFKAGVPRRAANGLCQLVHEAARPLEERTVETLPRGRFPKPWQLSSEPLEDRGELRAKRGITAEGPRDGLRLERRNPHLITGAPAAQVRRLPAVVVRVPEQRRQLEEERRTDLIELVDLFAFAAGAAPLRGTSAPGRGMVLAVVAV